MSVCIMETFVFSVSLCVCVTPHHFRAFPLRPNLPRTRRMGGTSVALGTAILGANRWGFDRIIESVIREL